MQKKFYNLSFFVFLKNMFQKVKYNLKDAQDLGITNDDKVVIYNKYGRVKVYISDSVPRGVLWSPRQFIGLNGEPPKLSRTHYNTELVEDLFLIL